MVSERIGKCGVMPIVNTMDYKNAGLLAKAMTRAGMTVCEVVFRNENAGLVLAEMISACPEMLIGAGTILTEEQVDTVKNIGAAFTVSPGLDRELTRYCLEQEILPIPGATSASEVQLAVRLGLKTVKFFPAKQMGGLSTIDALAAPFPQVKYIPTNGVGFDNMEEYLKNPHILACGGTFPCPPDMIATRDFDGISRLCEKALNLVCRARETLTEEVRK